MAKYKYVWKEIVTYEIELDEPVDNIYKLAHNSEKEEVDYDYELVSQEVLTES